MKLLNILFLSLLVTITNAESKLSGELGVGHYFKGPKATFPYFKFSYNKWTFGLGEVYKTYDYDKFIYLSTGLEVDINSITYKERDNVLLFINVRTYLARWLALESKVQQDFLDDYHGSRYSFGLNLKIPILKNGNLVIELNPVLINENNKYAKVHYKRAKIQDQGLNHLETNVAVIGRLTKSTQLIWFYKHQKLDKIIKNVYPEKMEENGLLFKLSF